MYFVILRWVEKSPFWTPRNPHITLQVHKVLHERSRVEHSSSAWTTIGGEENTEQSTTQNSPEDRGEQRSNGGQGRAGGGAGKQKTGEPPWYYSLHANKFRSIASTWLLANFLQSFLQSSGAFEVYCNGELVFSKLKENRFPGEIELRELVGKRLANTRFFNGIEGAVGA